MNRSQRFVHRARYHWGRFNIDDAGHGDWTSPSEHRTIQVRFSTVPESIRDALHGIRAIERHFGRIRDYRLLRDSEVRSEYQAMCWAAFESPASLLRVPQQGTTLKVALPPPLGRPEGGPGLDDLKSLLEPQDRCEPENEPSPARSVTLSIKRADTPITFRSTTKPPFRSRAMRAALGHGFLEWGGFAPLEPLHGSSPFTSPAQDLPPVDSPHMRMALNKWSQIVGVADPLFPEMKQPWGHESSDWEPLSEPDSVQSEVPENAPGSLRQSLQDLLRRQGNVPSY